MRRLRMILEDDSTETFRWVERVVDVETMRPDGVMRYMLEETLLNLRAQMDRELGIDRVATNTDLPTEPFRQMTLADHIHEEQRRLDAERAQINPELENAPYTVRYGQIAPVDGQVAVNPNITPWNWDQRIWHMDPLGPPTDPPRHAPPAPQPSLPRSGYWGKPS